MKKNQKASKSAAKISSTDRLEALLTETESELANLEPQIEKLEKQIEKLKELKLAKQKLITLKLSIKSILNNFSETSENISGSPVNVENLQSLLSQKTYSSISSTSSFASSTSPAMPEGTFLPELAFSQVNAHLRKKTSINYELFRAIVFNGGRATTEQIKQYLTEHNIKQPASGESFEAVELTDISSRVNYLVRKGLVTPDGRGTFVSTLGWTQPVLGEA